MFCWHRLSVEFVCWVSEGVFCYVHRLVDPMISIYTGKNFDPIVFHRRDVVVYHHLRYLVFRFWNLVRCSHSCPHTHRHSLLKILLAFVKNVYIQWPLNKIWNFYKAIVLSLWVNFVENGQDVFVGSGWGFRAILWKAVYQVMILDSRQLNGLDIEKESIVFAHLFMIIN